MYVTTVATNPAWAGLSTFNVRGFYPNQNNHMVVVPEGTLVYRPEHPADWTQHLGVMRALEFLVLKPGRDQQVEVEAWPARFLMFPVHGSWLPGLLDGSLTEREILVGLEASSGV